MIQAVLRPLAHFYLIKSQPVRYDNHTTPYQHQFYFSISCSPGMNTTKFHKMFISTVQANKIFHSWKKGSRLYIHDKEGDGTAYDTFLQPQHFLKRTVLSKIKL